MHMGMVVIIGGRRLASRIRPGRRRVMIMVVIMLVTVVTEMGHMVWRMFQHVANARNRGSDGIQRKQDGKKEGQAGAHRGQLYQ